MSKVKMGEVEQEEIVDHESEKKEAASAASRLQLSSSSLREALSSTSSLSRLSLSLSLREQHHDEEGELKWAAIERLPTLDRLHTSLPLHAKANAGDGAHLLEPVDVRTLGAADRRELVHNLIADIHKDNLRLLRYQRRRMDRVGVRQPTVEVRWRNVRVEAECQVVDGKPLPTLLNSAISTLSLLTTMLGFKRNQERIHILKDVTGILKPSRMTLLLGPPGCGKTSLLLALAGKLNRNLKVTGETEYNGVKLQDFVPEKTAAYIGQYDLHVPEMTVRETLDFSARFQGVGSRAEIMKEVIRREKEAGITPDPDIDTYMKAISVEGLERSMQTDYIMKIMGLDICADVLVGDAMRRGISGGEKKRLTTGEMIVGPSKALFMDEISTGLDSSTTFQIVSCLQQLAHISESTILVSLLQPAPETYDLFDDIILMAEGQIVYHGRKDCIMSFFESCGFKCPERKGGADFLQEVLSKKDQQQYWSRTKERYNFVTVDQFCDKFKASPSGQNLAEELLKPYDKSKGHKDALSFSIYSLSKLDLLKACFARELLLMKRNAFPWNLSMKSIAVELVSNPSIIFMDEPTSGLDARAAAIVMRAVKNVADTGRTVVCTIHQPSIEIFEAFDELLLMKRGGKLIYAGPLGHLSCEVIRYFQEIPGVPRIKDNYNPSTWMLEVTSTSMEVQLGVDFAQMYRESSMCKDKNILVKRLSIPVPGTSDLHFPTQFPQKFWEQFKACLWKQSLSYWRTPSYNLVRMVFITVTCISFGVLFILGCMYGITLFSGINNCQSVMPFVSVERSVVYRERFAGMYSPWAYSFAQVAMEIPYVLVQVVLFMVISYPMVGYTWTPAKFFWFMYTMFCTLLYFLYLGMLMVSLTPNIQVASILASMFYTLQNLMCGFIVPRWWIWLYYISPMSWTLNVFFTTQFGDDTDRMVMVFGETKSIAVFMRDYFGFRRDLLPLSAIALAAFPILFAVLFGYNISKLNFQRR